MRGWREPMVFLILTRRAYEEILALLGRVPSPMWVNGGVLSNDEIGEIRQSGVDLTTFTRPFDRLSAEAINDAAATVREHHPNEIVWVESPSDTTP